MRFDDANEVDSICYQLRVSSWPRSENRAAINRLFNGFPPFTIEEQETNDINVNYNSLTGTRKAHDARGQIYSAICKPGNYFRAVSDIGPKHSRSKNSDIVTRHANKLLKKSLSYYELQRAKIAQAVLHGIGPSVWRDCDTALPSPASIEDIYIPSGELSELPMDRLPLFAIHKDLSGKQLIEMTRKPNRDPGWNMEAVEACLKWIDSETKKLYGQNWPELWSPEKWGERIKEGDCYGWAQSPTIQVYDFYYYDDTGKESGWKRRMILDSWGTPSIVGGNLTMNRKQGTIYERGSKGKKATREGFLYTSKERFVAKNKSELVCFQFADLSAVAPFRYGTIRGLGYLLHDALHIQNRLICKTTEATFETLTMLMRVKSQEDVQRALKANLFNRGFVDETVSFIPQSDRWQVNTGLVELGIEQNQQLVDASLSTHSQNQDMSRGVEKGQLQIMAELNATTALLAPALMQYYAYQEYEYREIFRRLLNRKKDCRDINVLNFRAACLKDGVPEAMISNPDGWEITAERVVGAGNKTLAMAISGQLMQWRSLYDPASQRTILRNATCEITDDPALADELVPDEPSPSDTVHDTELVFGTIMGGTAVTPKDGLNSVEAASKTIQLMGEKIQEIMKSGGVGTPQDVHGLTMAAGYAAHFIKNLEDDKEQAKTVQKLNSALGKIGNQIKAMIQRQTEQAKKAQQQNGNGQPDPKAVAAAQATMLQAKVKAKIASDTHAQRTAERTISFQNKLKEQQQKHEMDMHKAVVEHGLEIHKKDLEGAANVRRGGMKSFESGDET